MQMQKQIITYCYTIGYKILLTQKLQKGAKKGVFTVPFFSL